jgi:hypothetical protein
MVKEPYHKDEEWYFDLEPGQVVLEGTPGGWDASGVHTLSIVEADRDGWKYWGYYCGGDYYYSFGTGLARSNDLLHWTKYTIEKPLLGSDSAGYGGRWPSVVRIDETFYMFVTKDYKTDSHIVLYTSRDGIKFDFLKDIVRPESGLRNQNPNLFYNENEYKWYLYYYHGNDRDLFQILAKCSDDLTELDKGRETMVLQDKNNEIVAAPSMFCWKGKYYLLTETTIKNKDDWRTLAWSSHNPISGFVELKNSPLPGFIHACAFQHYLNNNLVITYSYQQVAHPTWKWDIRITQAITTEA